MEFQFFVLYPFRFNSIRHLQTDENEKLFKELRMKSGSNHLGVKQFLNSVILLISLLCYISLVFSI